MAEFDFWASKYKNYHKKNTRFVGSMLDYAAEYKTVILASFLKSSGYQNSPRILDFGCGIGTSLPYIRKHCPSALLTGADVSGESLHEARQQYGDIAEYRLLDGKSLPFPDQSFEAIFTACVFHHIPEAVHLSVLAELRRILVPAGFLIIFENNPYNPVMRYAVATCPFDKNAVLQSCHSMKQKLKSGFFTDISAGYCVFFPNFLAKLRTLEHRLSWCPLGAQYFVLGKKC